MAVLKVKSWGKGQGDHVLIDEANFDPKKHVLFDAPAKKVTKKKAAKK